MDASQITKLLQKQNTRYINRATTVDSSTMIWRNQIQSSKYIKGVATCTGLQNPNVPTEAIECNPDGTSSYGGGGKQMTLSTGSTKQYPSVFKGASGSASQVYSSDAILLQRAGRALCSTGLLDAPLDPYVILPSCYGMNTNGPTRDDPNPPINNNCTNPFLPPFDTYYKFKNVLTSKPDQNLKHYVEFCNGKVVEPPRAPLLSPWPAFIVGTNEGSSITTSSITYDGDNVYLTGTYTGTVDFYAGGRTDLTTYPMLLVPVVTLLAPNRNNGFVAQYSREGDIKWIASINVRTMNTVQPTAQGYSVQADAAGITVLGYLNETVEFYSGYYNGITTGTWEPVPGQGQSMSSTNGLFLARYNKDGNLLWLNLIDNVNAPTNAPGFGASPLTMSHLSTNGIQLYAATTFSGTVNLYAPNQFGAPLLSLVALHNLQALVVQYNVVDGTFQWAIKTDTPDVQASVYSEIAVQCDANHVYVSGYMVKSLQTYTKTTVSSSGTVSSTLTSIGDSHTKDAIYVLSYSTDGTFQWANRCDALLSYFYMQSVRIAVDATGLYLMAMVGQEVNVYRTHGTSSSTPSNPTMMTGAANTNQFAILKYNDAGNIVWMTKLTGVDTNGLSVNYNGCGIVSDGIGVYVTGGFTTFTLTLYNGAFVDPTVVGATIVPLNTTTSNPVSNIILNAFLVRYDTNGTVQWSTRAGQDTSTMTGCSVSTELSRVMMTGWATGPIDFYNANGVIGTSLRPAITDNYYSYVVAYDTDGNVIQ